MTFKFKKGDYVQVMAGTRKSWVGVVDKYMTKKGEIYVRVDHLNGNPVGGYYETSLSHYHPPVKISHHYLVVPSTGD